MSQIGKKPLSQKPRQASTPLSLDDIFGNPLGVHPEVEKILKEKGFVYRWINAGQMSKMGGWHPRHWRPIKVSELKSWGAVSADFLFGQSEDGFVRRGDTVLGVRTVELNEQHKNFLQRQASESRSKNRPKAQRERLRDMVRETGLPVTVTDDHESE